MRLFSYCIPVDDGAAPNPFWGKCTLVICKPVIRRNAEIGDWIVGTGSKVSPIGDISKKVVYTMKITEKMTLEDYNIYCKVHLPEKIPDWTNRDIRRRLGDCIYDYTSKAPSQRKGVHNKGNMEKDLRGEYALLSDYFYYFGNQPIPLSENLYQIIKDNQGHRSTSNDPHIGTYLDWLKGLGLKVNTIFGEPQLKIFDEPNLLTTCAQYRCDEADVDEKQSDRC